MQVGNNGVWVPASWGLGIYMAIAQVLSVAPHLGRLQYQQGTSRLHETNKQTYGQGQTLIHFSIQLQVKIWSFG